MKPQIILTAFLLLLAQLSIAQYQEGLDPSFGVKGITTIDDPTGFRLWLINGEKQSNGKIVALSSANISRFNTNGSFDKSFGINGFFADNLYYDDTYLLTGNFRFSCIGVQPDDKILIAGYADYFSPALLLFRLMPDGHLDPSFAEAGIFSNNKLGAITANGLSIQADGKIVVMCQAYSTDYQVLVRFKSNGIIDSSFGTYGKVENSLIEMSGQPDIELLPDGRILAMGDDFAVARYLSEGISDTSFNHTGVGYVFPGSSAPYSKAMGVQADGKIWVGGYTAFLTPGPFIVGRLNANGSADSSLGGTAAMDYPWDTGNYNKCFDLLALPDGKILLGGIAGNPVSGKDNFALIRIKNDGTVDSSFGINGRLLTQMFDASIEQSATLYKLLLQADNKIVGLGSYGASFGSGWALTRYEASGKTGLPDLPKSGTEISIYPNPADSRVYYKLPDNQKAEQLSLLNMQGQMMLHTNQPKENEIETGSLPNGCYILHISSGTAVFTQKLVIFH